MPLSGRKHLIAHMEGKRLSFKQAILAKCYECMNGFIDGKQDCRIFDCPLYPFMPFSSRKPAKKPTDPTRRCFGRPFGPSNPPPAITTGDIDHPTGT